MRIGVLAKGGADWIGGLYYTFNLIRALRTLPDDEQPDIILLVPDEDETNQFTQIAPLAELCPVPKHDSGGSAASTVNPALARLLSDRRIDMVFPCMRSMGSEFPVPWLPWVPDLQHKHYPEFFSTAECEQRDCCFHRVATDAQLVVLSSRNALVDFNRFYPGHQPKLRVLHFTTVPLPEWRHSDASETTRRFDLPIRYLMLPNQFWVHKNHRVAFEAVNILTQRGLDVHLVCTGKTEDPRRPEHFPCLCDFIKDHNLADRIHILGLLPRREQIQVMRAATAIVQPSLFEGWSTVVEDARLFAKRMFLSDIAVHREQHPEGATYFDPHRPEALADEIEKAWDSLPDSPCPAAEDKALSARNERVAAYARDFLHIAHELLQVDDNR